MSRGYHVMASLYTEERMKYCTICGREVRGTYHMILERKTDITTITWDYPLCMRCFDDMRVSYAEMQTKEGDSDVDSESAQKRNV